MEWIPYFSILAKRHNELKYTNLYKVLPELWTNYLDNCHKENLKSSLSELIRMIQETEMQTPTFALLYTLENGNSDVDSITTIYHRITNRLPQAAIMQVQGESLNKKYTTLIYLSIINFLM